MIRKKQKESAWRCYQCGQKLPTKGLTWSHRFYSSREYRLIHNDSGYLCDSCKERNKL